MNCDKCDKMFFLNGRKTTAFECGHAMDGIMGIVKKYPWVDFEWLIEQSRYFGKDKLVATTDCHPDDEFDEETGRKIAARKLNKLIKEQQDRIVIEFERSIYRQLKAQTKKELDVSGK